MHIIGRGLIARMLRWRLMPCDDTVAFATGVGNSACTDVAKYRRELDLLEESLNRCQREDKRLLYFSTATHVHGALDGLRDESTALAPCTAYGQHKCAAESLVRSFSSRHLIVRLPNLVGPCQNPRQLVPRLIQQMLSGRTVVFQYATRDLLDVVHLGEILEEMLPRAKDRETVVVASGISAPVTQLVNKLHEILDMQSKIVVKNQGDRQEFRTDHLRELAPESSNRCPDYPYDVLETYASRLVAQLTRLRDQVSSCRESAKAS